MTGAVQSCERIRGSIQGERCTMDLIDRTLIGELVDSNGNVHYEDIINLPSAQPLQEEDLLELEHRFGEWVRFVVEDMISGKGERWLNE